MLVQDPQDLFHYLFLGSLVYLCKKHMAALHWLANARPMCLAWAETKSKEELVCGSILFHNAAAQACTVL